ncbi:MAG TPA: DUF86 domain-containing protein [Methanoregulaceae archaeon]|jgi:uncharacterized protein YutE (UPF0331/DUF86 family)|nr:DUF86 domain-containing protein [Methanoregulaceae archaeon]
MRILAQLQTLDEALGAWQRYREIPFDRFAREQDIQYMVRHALLLAIQAAIDIATGIAVMKTPKRPDTYRETFRLLGRFSVIPEDLSTELARLAGFRNLIVHEYTTLDQERVYRILQDDCRTLHQFRLIVRDFIRQNP